MNWDQRRRAELRQLAHRSREALLLASVVGVVTGFGVALLDWVIVDQALGALAELPLAVQCWIPLAGLLITTLVLRAGGRLSPSTADEYIVAFHSRDDLALRPLPWRLGAAITTLGSGVPGGLEGPSIYIGAGVGTLLQQRFRRVFGATEAKNLMVAGAAAGVAAIFKAPATGAVFALEVPYRDDLGRRMLIPALVGAASGYLAFVSVTDADPLLEVTGRAPFDLRDLVGALALGAVTGVVIRGYAAALRVAKRFQRDRRPVLTAIGGGVVVGILATVAQSVWGEQLALTPGYDAIRWAADPRHSLPAVGLLLAIRLTGTVASVAAGGVLGLFVPLVVAGALIGRVAGGILGAHNVSLFLVLGVAAALGAGYRVPLAAVMFVAEATGRAGFVVPGLLAAVGADLVMGDSSVTAYQRSGASVDEYH